MVNEESAGLEILSKAGAIVRELRTRGECSVAEIAEAVGEPVSSTYRLVSSLRAIGWIDPAPRRGAVRLGLEVLRIGTAVEEQRDLQDIAMPRLRELRDATRLTTYLCVPHGSDAVCVARYGGRDVRYLELSLGGTLPLDRGGAPRAILAHLPRPEQERVLGDLGRGKRERSLTLAELPRIRDSGVALSDEDVTAGMGAVGCAIVNRRCEVVGAVSLSGVRAMVLDDASVAEAAREAADEISAALGWRPGGSDG